MKKVEITEAEVKILVAKSLNGDAESFDKLEIIYSRVLKNMSKRFANRNVTECYQDYDDWFQIVRIGLHEAVRQYKDHFEIVYTEEKRFKCFRCVKNRRSVDFVKFLTLYILKNTNLEIRKIKKRMSGGQRIEVQTIADYQTEVADRRIHEISIEKVVHRVKKEISYDPVKLRLFELVLDNKGANAICTSLSIRHEQYNKMYNSLIETCKNKFAEISN